jgi:hypothetical protein
VRQSFLDVTTGELLREYGDIQKQVAGTGTGVLGDQKKISVAPGGSGFTTSDRLRPPAISSYDFRFNLNRLILFLNADGSPSNLKASDLGTDDDNVWTDGALVDAHVYSGWVYDYYFKRHGRRGLDNANIAVHSITHALRREDWRLYSTPRSRGSAPPTASRSSGSSTAASRASSRRARPFRRRGRQPSSPRASSTEAAAPPRPPSPRRGPPWASTEDPR